MGQKCDVCERVVERKGRCCSNRCYEIKALQPNCQIDLHLESRGACTTLPGRCEFVSCRHNIDGDEIRDRAAANRVCPDNCAIRVAKHTGGLTLEDVSLMFGLTRERIRQIEAKGLHMAAVNAKKLKLGNLIPPEGPTYESDITVPLRRAG